MEYMDAPATSKQETDEAIDRLVGEYRATCLWYTPKGYRPSSDLERLRALESIERHADREGFKRARDLREWLLRLSREL